jgi:hypothetical protein
MPTRLQLARTQIIDLLNRHPTHVFSKGDLSLLFNDHRSQWRLAMSTSFNQFTDYLRKSGSLRVVKFPFAYRPTSRYVWGQVPLYPILLTLRPNCHFSHYTAMQLHDLTEQQPKTIYINWEQPPKPIWGQPLEQANIKKAFSRPQRLSSNEIEMEGWRVVLLNGKNTGYLGVEDRPWADPETKQNYTLRVTGIERTLIDIAVRPVYAGGVAEVLKAYSRAAGRVSINRLSAMLKKLAYVYPYHQAIGFYIERSGAYDTETISLFREKFTFDYDFYLTYGMKETEYVKPWRLYVPAGFAAASS